MSYFRLSLSALVVGILSVFISFGIQAEEASTTTTTVIEKHPITTPPPAGTCTIVGAHYEGDVWVDKYTTCVYSNRPEGASWVGDHWSCTDYSATGDCKNWTFVQGAWVNK